MAASQPVVPEGFEIEADTAEATVVAPNALPELPDGFEVEAVEPERGALRAGLQGVTFGFGDEAVAGLVAAARKAAGDERPFSDIYDDVAQNEREQIAQYRDAAPVKAFMSEAGGSLLTGISAGVKVLGKEAVKRLPKWLSTAGIGAVEGGVYGAGTSDPGERTKGAAAGAATGAVVAPVATAVFSVAGKLMGDMGKYVAKRLSDTPEREAQRIIREAATKAGLNADDIVKRYQRLGPDGLLLDTDENFRGLMRALSDSFGPAKRAARDVLEDRQLGQIGRLVREIEDASGLSADDYLDSVKALAQKRAQSAGPLYDSAFATANPSDEMLALAERPSLKSALARAKRLAADEGDATADLSFKHFHYAKMALDDRIGAAIRDNKGNEAKSLLSLKKVLLAEMDEVAPDYRAARDLYAGDSALLQAAEAGRKFYQLSMDDFADAVSGMSQSELEMFKRGSVKAIVDKLGDSQLTYDNAKKLVGTPALQGKLSVLFKSRDAAARFIEQARAEREFTRTRTVVTGGSPTSQNLAGKEAVEESLGGVSAVLRGDKLSAGLEVLGKVFGKKPPSPETIKKATDLLLKRNMTQDEIRALFRQSGLAITDADITKAGNAVRGTVAAEIETTREAIAH